jgi:hypothetical protein
MRLKILETKTIDNRHLYLCKGSLLEYLQNLKEDFYEYAIQRKIVKNQYLDKIYTTVKIGDPLPSITLTYNKPILDNIKDNKATIDLEESEILDGLQRSFRLWAYYRIASIYEKDTSLDFRNFAQKVKLDNPLFFETGVISTRLLKSMIEENEIENIKKVFLDFDIYFTIWTGLNEKEIIQKMLVLNAGQKSVSKTHQFELLFLHFFEYIQDSGVEIKLYREKDPKASNIKRGKREIGDFMFSSVIVSLQSFVEERPLRVSTEKLIEHEFGEKETKYSIYDVVFNSTYLLFYLKELIELDKLISKSEIGKEWFSKDTTLSGIFAAIGTKVKISHVQNEEELIKKTNLIIQDLKKQIRKVGWNLDKFTGEYNVLSSRTVNIGNFIRKVVMEYTLSLLEQGSPNWNEIFTKVKEKR